jgi:hypothetical protein
VRTTKKKAMNRRTLLCLYLFCRAVFTADYDVVKVTILDKGENLKPHIQVTWHLTVGLSVRTD